MKTILTIDYMDLNISNNKGYISIVEVENDGYLQRFKNVEK